MVNWWLGCVRLFSRLWLNRVFGRYSPVVAILNLTRSCNYSCPYCFVDCGSEVRDLEFSEWCDIIDELKGRGTELIILQGGEPLIYPRVGDIIDYVKSCGMLCHMATNGSLISSHLEDVKKLDLLMVSLDGREFGNDLNRCLGAFEKTMKGIDLLTEHDIPFRINSVLTRNNVDDIDWLLNFADERGAYVGFTIPAKCPGVDSMGDSILVDEEVKAVHEKLVSLKRGGSMITLSDKSLQHVIDYPLAYHEIVKKTDSGHKSVCSTECAYGRQIIFLDTDGAVYPCTTLWELPDQYRPKNIFVDGWDNALGHVQNLPCWICYCAGGIAWNEISSFRGLKHTLEFSMSQRRNN